MSKQENRPVFSFRPNMDNLDHKKAWEILKGVPDGQKNAYLARAILQASRLEEVRQIIRETVREELNGGETQRSVSSRKESIPDEMLSFLENL